MRSIPTKTDGVSTLSAAEFNDIPSELGNAITANGQTLSSGDLFQLSKTISSYVSVGDFYTDSGSANAYVLTSTGSFKAPTAYVAGMRIRFKPGNVNTGASTVNVASLGLKSIKTLTGASDPAAGDIAANVDITLVYDGTYFRIISAAPLVVATQAQQETATDITTAVTPGRQHYHPSAAKYWVNWQGTGTVAIKTSYNTTSITDNGTGDYTVTIATDFSSAIYCNIVSGGRDTSLGSFCGQVDYSLTTLTAGTVRVGTADGASNLIDYMLVDAVGFGDQ